MRFYLVAAIIISMGLVSCAKDKDAAQEAGSGISEQAHEVAATHGLTLDGDKKWVMDDHTRSVFATMSQRTKMLAGAPEELGAILQGDLDKLIKGCTMKGAAHDELHKFLMAYMPAVKQLSEQGGGEALAEVKSLLGMYPKYFE